MLWEGISGSPLRACCSEKNLRTNSKGSSRATLLAFKRPTPKQTSCEFQRSPGERRQKRKRDSHSLINQQGGQPRDCHKARWGALGKEWSSQGQGKLLSWVIQASRLTDKAQACDSVSNCTGRGRTSGKEKYIISLKGWLFLLFILLDLR